LLSHVSVGVSDFERAYRLYADVLGVLNAEPRYYDPAECEAGWQSPGGTRPLFVIGKPYNRQPHHPGNGQMVAFTAATREVVRLAYAKALSHGATCEGPPGLRPHYHPHYYGAYVRDPDGNKICVVCHTPEDVG
jgi:catechol 2,3-dioxygenase-like lactoylglutathione lyase family enzyme